MKTIPLTQGKVALVDDEDYKYLNQWKWHANKNYNNYYAARTIHKPKDRTIFMHRIILNASNEMRVDHINGNGLDNQKINLRFCSNSENCRNRRLNYNNTIGFKGVNIDKRNFQKPYYARIWLNNKCIHVGCYHTAKKAAQAYDKAALKYYKKFALTNKMLGLLK